MENVTKVDVLNQVISRSFDYYTTSSGIGNITPETMIAADIDLCLTLSEAFSTFNNGVKAGLIDNAYNCTDIIDQVIPQLQEELMNLNATNDAIEILQICKRIDYNIGLINGTLADIFGVIYTQGEADKTLLYAAYSTAKVLFEYMDNALVDGYIHSALFPIVISALKEWENHHIMNKKEK